MNKVDYGIWMGSGKFTGKDFYAAGTKHYSYWSMITVYFEKF